MKRTLFILLAVLCLNGCMIIDWVPVTFQVRVQDENGKDLLDPANDNTWLIGTHISFNGTSDTIVYNCYSFSYRDDITFLQCVRCAIE